MQVSGTVGWVLTGVVFVLVACGEGGGGADVADDGGKVDVQDAAAGDGGEHPEDAIPLDKSAPDVTADFGTDQFDAEVFQDAEIPDIPPDGLPLCVGEGRLLEDPGPDQQCCPGLSEIPDCVNEADGEPACMCTEASMCTYCGDTECDPGENECNCPEDCPLAPGT